LVEYSSFADGSRGCIGGLPISSHVVALAGPRGCGKSTIAQHLVEQHGFERLAFSDVLREIAMLAGPERVNDRQYLSDLGQVLRSYDPQFLLKAMQEKLNRGTKVVIEDIRFPQELDFSREQGIFTVYLDLDETEQLQRIQKREVCSIEVARQLAAIADNHLLNRAASWDKIITSEGDFRNLASKIVSISSPARKRHHRNDSDRNGSEFLC
jgi:dephospho-CoA kinase